jgi:hypothetical protein
MSAVPVNELRRIAETLATLRGRVVQNAVLRSDLRQLRLEFADGLMAVVSLGADDEGRPRLEFDLVSRPEGVVNQLEVRFETP